MASAYKHGVYVSEQETSLIAPVKFFQRVGDAAGVHGKLPRHTAHAGATVHAGVREPGEKLLVLFLLTHILAALLRS